MNIYGKKVLLRAMEIEDSEFIQNMFNNPEIEGLVTGWSFPLSLYSQRKWYENHHSSCEYRFIIQTINDGRSIGVATLTDIDWKNRNAFHGMKISATSDRGNGYGTDTVMAIMRYAFDELGLNRLDGSWFPDNIPSKNMYLRCGWKEEGIRRKHVYKNGKYKDVVISGILAEEYYTMIRTDDYWQRK